MERTKFMGKNRKLNSVFRKDGLTEVLLPEYVLKNRQRHEYDPDEEAIYKQCIGCKNWFKVAIIGKNNEFGKVADDRDFFRIKSGFRNYCETCFHQKKSDKSKTAHQSSFSEKVERGSISFDDEIKKRSYETRGNNHTYLVIRSRLEHKSLGAVINEILDKERENHKLF